jgi:hypothetical protein
MTASGSPRRIEIAEHWAATHPPRAARAALEMDARRPSSRAFGGIFEHSPWIAERAHALELGPAHDTARRRAQRAGPHLPRRQPEASGWACCAPIPISPASWPRPSG